MPPTSPDHDTAVDLLVAQLTAHEQARCRALVEDDFGTLATLLHEDLRHTHNNGRSEDRQAYLQAMQERLRVLECERGELTIKRYGNVAVMSGLQISKVALRHTDDMKAMTAQVLQVWHETSPGRWQLLAFQSTLIA